MVLNKKYIVLALILILAVLLWFAVNIFQKQSPEIKNFDSKGETIIAFGDSLVFGIGSSELRKGGFISLLSERIDEPIINLGKSGDTTTSALNRIDSVIAKNPKIVIVLLGGNDYLRKIPVKETFNNLQMIIDKIYANNSAVLLLGVRGGVLKDSYNQLFKKLAEKNKTAFVPNVMSGLLGNKNLMSDAIHPNDAGYSDIADKVLPILKKMLKK